MKTIAIYPNATMDTYSIYYLTPQYPITRSLSNICVNVWDLPTLIEEKVALLRMVKPGDAVPDIGTRQDTHYVVYVPDDYEIPGLA